MNLKDLDHTLRQVIATRFDFTGRQIRILNVVLDFSTGCGRTQAAIPRKRYFQDRTGIDPSDVSAEITRLVKLNVLLVQSGIFYQVRLPAQAWRVRDRLSDPDFSRTGEILRALDPAAPIDLQTGLQVAAGDLFPVDSGLIDALMQTHTTHGLPAIPPAPGDNPEGRVPSTADYIAQMRAEIAGGASGVKHPDPVGDPPGSGVKHPGSGVKHPEVRAIHPPSGVICVPARETFKTFKREIEITFKTFKRFSEEEPLLFTGRLGVPDRQAHLLAEVELMLGREEIKGSWGFWSKVAFLFPDSLDTVLGELRYMLKTKPGEIKDERKWLNASVQRLVGEKKFWECMNEAKIVCRHPIKALAIKSTIP